VLAPQRRRAAAVLVAGLVVVLTGACSSGRYEQAEVAVQSAVVTVPRSEARAVELSLDNCAPDARMPYHASLTQTERSVTVAVTGPVWQGGAGDRPLCASRLTIHLDQPLGQRPLLDAANGDAQVSVTESQSR
jgi:hypothetical protein